MTWINDVLEGQRIIVRDIVEDIYDGQVLGELLSECMWENWTFRFKSSLLGTWLLYCTATVD